MNSTLRRLWTPNFVLALSLTGLISSVRAQVAPPTITVIPESGLAGTEVQVRGDGWAIVYQQPPYQIRWETQNGPLLGSFTPNSNGVWQTAVTIPNATPGLHTIWACSRCDSSPVWASDTYRITPGPVTPTVFFSLPTPTPTPVPASECDPTGAPGEAVIDFESFPPGTSLRGVTLPEGIVFDEFHDAVVVDPVNAVPRSETRVLQGPILMEFRSTGVPIHFTFTRLAEFVGVFVGLDEPAEFGEPVLAELTAWGLDPEGNRYLAGRDSVNVGPDVTNVHHCLHVSDPRIYEVTIDYATGDPELIDNLIFRLPAVPEEPPADDRPPEVTITHPADGTMVSTSSVRLDGEVIEDRDLDRLDVLLNGIEYRGIGFSFAGDTPDGRKRFLFALDAIPISDLIQCLPVEIRVVAYDTAGNAGHDEVNIRVLYGDLTLTQVEPVQVVFGAPLVMGKNTAFRARVTSTFPCELDVAFRLTLPEEDWDTSLIGGLPADVMITIVVPPDWRLPEITLPTTIPPNATEFVVMLPVVPLGMEQAGWNSETNPSGMLGYARQVPRPIDDLVTFGVEIDPENDYTETDEANNQLDGGRHAVVTTHELDVVFVPFAFNFAPRTWETQSYYEFYLTNRGYSDVAARIRDVRAHLSRGSVALGRALSLEDIRRLQDVAYQQATMLLGGFPVAEGKFHYWFDSTFLRFREDYYDTIGYSNLCEDMRFLSDTLHAVQAANPQVDFVVMENIAGCCGRSPMGPDTSLRSAYVDSAIDWPYGPEWYHYCALPTPPPDVRTPTPGPWPSPLGGAGVGNILHELAHNYDGSADCYSCWTDTVDCDSCVTDADGFWVNEWQLIPQGTDCFMHAVCPGCTLWWTLGPIRTDDGRAYPDGYANLVRHFASTADPQALLVHGRLALDGSAEFFHLSVLGETRLDLEAGSEGTHYFVLKDASGQELARAGFLPSFEYMLDPQGVAVTLDEVSFVYRIPWDAAAARVELQDVAGNVLAWRQVSPSAPSVELLSPAGGETWNRDGAYRVRWRASDPDGDTLMAAVHVSLDGGQTWLPVVTDLEGDQYELDASAFNDGQSFLVRVVVNDGIHSASATVPSPLTAHEMPAIPAPVYVGLAILLAGALVAAGLAVAWIVQRRKKRG